ncbi:MAG TPA: alkyl sulfatase dimerization domain-containing protein [Caulobacteraceae bacterium]
MEPKPATAATRQVQATASAGLPEGSDADFADARRGFIGTIPDGKIVDEAGRVFWDMSAFAFEAGDGPVPDTVHPGLWRQAQLNSIHGLFEVARGIYQVRNFDLSNITFIEGEKGWIVVDPLISSQNAAAALKLLFEHRGARPVTAVIYTHSHVDHYGGVRGVIGEAEIAGGVPIIAPEGFVEAAVSENVLLGNAMNRRATYMYGSLLPKNPTGHVDAGLGKTVSMGEVSLIPPTESISRTGTRLLVDGVEILFQLTPDTEAPAEMNFLFPKSGALCMAENCTCHLHNIYTPRGAQVRDAKAWSRYIDEAIELFIDRTEVLFASHHWPRWGRERARAFLEQQRDLYKFVHDQTLRLANHGLTAAEIAETLELPPTLAAEWHTRGLYGTLNHNAKAVYQRYLGWFDGNPANLHRLPPVEAAEAYVALAGGAAPLLAQARAAFEAGNYRWVGELVNHLVFADPLNREARELQADALEQLGYQSESGPWRAFYLTGAMELRHPRPASGAPRQVGGGQLRALPADKLLDSLSVRLDGVKAGASRLALEISFTDTGETFAVRVENGVLNHRRGVSEGAAKVRLTRATLIALVFGETSLQPALADGSVSIEGEGGAFADFLCLLDRFDFWFEIIAP